MNMIMNTRPVSPEFWNDYWKHSIGFDRVVDNIVNSVGSFAAFEGNYPPYDIVKESESDWKIIMALAGFKEEDISVHQKETILTITGCNKSDEEYVFKGIAKRKFKKIFPLVEGSEITNASLKDGLLEISINIAIPEEKKPRMIPINNNS